MDPISAFGLAVNVLSVIDFSKTFLEVLEQVKDAGSPAATQDIISITRSLEASNEKIKDQAWIAQDNKAFKDLIDGSQSLSKELIGLAEKLSVTGSSTLVSKIKVTARTMWNHSGIAERKARLEAIRGQLLYDIIVPMAEKVNTIPDTAALDMQTRTLLDAIIEGQDANKVMDERLRSFHQEYSAALQEQHVEVVSLLHGMRDGQSMNASARHRDVDQAEKERVLKKVRDALYFDHEKDRYDDIDRAHAGTLEWIYSKPPSADTGVTWSNFTDWLRNDSGIYWVSGKAGSGKSTLMKLLDTDDRLRDTLLEWGAGGRLLVLSFYFWNPGTPLQKSLEGLYRSVLLQALQECPELGRKLFPDRFEHSVQWAQFPTMHQLKRAFTCLTAGDMTDPSGAPLKLVLFIDGLDEFDAGALNHSELCEVFTSAAKSSSFKAILSSRPENAFENAFRDCPKLRLHHLTRSDVVKYVNDKLRDHPRMQQLISQSPEDSEALISEIVEAAQGVFLWVRLVVRSLLEGLQNHDEMEVLIERLHELPTDLEDLFRYMLQRVPGRYKEGMSKMFQILRSNTEIQSYFMEHKNAHMFASAGPLTALGLKFALLDEQAVLQAEASQFSVAEASAEINSIEVKVKSHCAGLIELSTADENVQEEPLSVRHLRGISNEGSSHSSFMDDAHNWDDPKVRFIHRSVPEYLWKEEVWDQILAQTDHLGFQPLVATLRSLVMQAKRCPHDCQSEEALLGGSGPWILVAVALEVAYRLEKAQGTAQMDLLDALETALTKRHGADWWDTYREDYTKPAPWHDNFFAFTVRYGLWRYVQARLQARGHESMQKRGRPLLDYACRPEPKYQVWLRGTDVRIVEALLEHGADPNLEFNGFTPWQNAWYTAWRFIPASRLLPVLEALLAHDANPNAYIENDVQLLKRLWQKRRRTVLLVAQNSNGNVFYAKTESEEKRLGEFIRMLRKRGAKAREWRVKSGAFKRHRTVWDGLPAQEKCTIL